MAPNSWIPPFPFNPSGIAQVSRVEKRMEEMCWKGWTSLHEEKSMGGHND
jgi:hypothetical protein